MQNNVFLSGVLSINCLHFVIRFKSAHRIKPERVGKPKSTEKVGDGVERGYYNPPTYIPLKTHSMLVFDQFFNTPLKVHIIWTHESRFADLDKRLGPKI